MKQISRDKINDVANIVRHTLHAVNVSHSFDLPYHIAIDLLVTHAADEYKKELAEALKASLDAKIEDAK